MKIWLDDVRPAPDGYTWCKSVNEAKAKIKDSEAWLSSGLTNLIGFNITLIDCDHDLGDYSKDGGDGIELLNWLERTERDYPIRIHTMNTVGRGNMRAVIRHNNWQEIDFT